MDDEVKRDLRTARRRQTEERLIAAATELFVGRGYAETTLAAVAEHAGVAARTVYVRFEGKADLLRRCIGVAIAGDLAAPPVAARDWMVDAMTAPTLVERIERMAEATASLMDRAGALLAVAGQAAGTEPAIAAAAQAGREETRRALHAFWQRIVDDDMVPDGCDVDWLSETATLLAHADTYLTLARTTRWDIDTYRRWLATTWMRLVLVSDVAPGRR